MPFGVAQVLTNRGRAITADRLRTTPATYTNAPKYIAAGVGATGAARTAAVADTALSSELAEGRVSGTETTPTTNVTGDSYQVAGTITATGARAVDEAGLFDAATVGNMFMSATFAVVNLASGDSLALTAKVTYS